MTPPVGSTRVAVSVAPVLRPDLRHYTTALREAGLLRRVYSGVVYHEQSGLGRVLRTADRLTGSRLYRATEARRVSAEAAPDELTALWWPEVAARAGRTLGLAPAAGGRFTDRVFAALDRYVAPRLRPTDQLVIGQEDCCLHTFRAAARLGVVRLYDLPIPYHVGFQRAMVAEEQRFPGVSTEDLPADTFAADRTARKTDELAAADHVLVASDYVLGGLLEAGVAADRITRIPYGCDAARPYRPHADRKPLVLYVGHLSLRKGVPRLLAAWKRLGAHRTHTLRLIGRMMLSPAFMSQYAGLYEHIPPLPRSELWAHFDDAQAFVFPSACDGFGLVLTESLSCGTPVVASTHTGAPGFITPGEQGLVYPHGDDDALAAHLDRVLSRPGETADMGRAAHAFAQRWGWAEYRAAVRGLAARLLAAPAGPA